MTKSRPYVLSIAGYDPCGGAGVLADIKTFENIGVCGLAVTTCITYQNDNKFEGVHWLSKKKIKNQLYPLLDAYKDTICENRIDRESGGAERSDGVIVEL